MSFLVINCRECRQQFAWNPKDEQLCLLCREKRKQNAKAKEDCHNCAILKAELEQAELKIEDLKRRSN